MGNTVGYYGMLHAELERILGILQDSALARNLNRENMVQDAKNRAATYNQLAQGAVNMMGNALQSAWGGGNQAQAQGGYSHQNGGYSHQNPYGNTGGPGWGNPGGSTFGNPQNPYGGGGGGNPYGNNPWGGNQGGGNGYGWGS